MKKIWKRALSVFCASLTAATMIGFASCSKEDDVVNAYDIAVKNGFQGTETQWLASLNGADGADGKGLDIRDIYEAATSVENGYSGTFLEFLKDYLALSVQENNATDIIAKNVSSVVSICAGFTVTTGKGTYSDPQKVQVGGSAGSGVIYKLNENAKTAYIITNYHVIYSKGTDTANDISDCIYVYPHGMLNGFSTEIGESNSPLLGNGYLDSGEEMGDAYGSGIKARYVGGAMDYDIAILETYSDDYFGEGTSATAADIWDSEGVTMGEKVFAVGNANGAGISVTSGVLSVESEYITMSAPDERDVSPRDGKVDGISYRVMRTDAAINHGNSGGALFNAAGYLIGITNAKNVEDETDNMGYALPITQVKYVVENILDNVKSDTAKKYVSRATLGIKTQITQSSGAVEKGKYVIKEEFRVTTHTIAITAAAYNKLVADDIIKTIKIGDGATVTLTRSYQLIDLMLTVRKGDTVTIGIVRNGQAQSVSIKFDQDRYFTTYA